MSMEQLTNKQAEALLIDAVGKSDEERIAVYRQVFEENGGMLTLDINNIDDYCWDYIRLGKKLGNDQIVSAICCSYCSRLSVKNIPPEQFEIIYQNVYSFLQKANSQMGLLMIQNVKVGYLSKIGQTQKALNLGIKGLQEAKSLKYNDVVFEFYFSLSMLMAGDNFAKASHYAMEGLKYAPANQKDRALYATAAAYLLKEEYATSLKYYKMLEEYCLQKDTFYLPYAYDGIIYNLSYLQQEKEIKQYYKKQLSLCKKIGNQNLIQAAHNHLGVLYLEKKAYLKAIPYFSKALDTINIYLSDQVDKADLKSLYGNLFLSHKQCGNFESALQFYEKHVTLKEELYSVETQNKINELNATFEAEKREEEITRLKKENELLDTIKAQKEALEQINLTKDRLFAIIGHDLRKPALSFRGIAKKVDYLLKKGDYKTLQLLGQGIEQDAYGLTKLTDNLLNWALTQREVMPYQPKALNLYHITEDTFDIFKSITKDKNIRLVHHIPETLTAYADQNSVLTILRNLVDNAVKYTPSGGTVIVEALEQKEGITFKIKDTGVGMTAEKVRDIFLLQKDKSEKGTAGEQGTGLGMHLVQELVKLNKGNIRVMSQLGQGTTFEVVLPKVA